MSKLTIVAILGLIGLVINDVVLLIQGQGARIDISAFIAALSGTIAAFHSGNASSNTAPAPVVQGPPSPPAK